MMKLGYRSGKLGKELTTFLEFMTAPATKILDKWFESDVLKATLATDAIIGAKVSPYVTTPAHSISMSLADFDIALLRCRCRLRRPGRRTFCSTTSWAK